MNVNRNHPNQRKKKMSWILLFKKGKTNFNINVHGCDEKGLESIIKMEAELGRKFVAKRQMNPWYNNGLRAVAY